VQILRQEGHQLRNWGAKVISLQDLPNSYFSEIRLD
jgi:hypothetical protein